MFTKPADSRILPFLFCLALISLPALRADQSIRCTNNGPTQTNCRIDEPNVRQRSTDYRQITFRTGDQITVGAGGCVQTGGRGRTWKRYVNPSGPDSNRLYFGTIAIPGATQGTVRVSEVLGRTLTVPPGVAASDLFLRLGYVDDNYGDNGYNDHDDGTENQCKGVGNAFVTLRIDRPTSTTTTCGGSTGNSPLDVVWTDCDPNGFPKNPLWRYTADKKGLPISSQFCPPDFGPACSTWPLTQDSEEICGPHANWFAVTVEGLVDWEELSGKKFGIFGDDDYNYRLFPVHDSVVTVHKNLNINGVEVEFNSDETIDHFGSPLWSAFHKLVDSNNAAAQSSVKQRLAVITGLLGLDCGHEDCASELHPAYGMAVNTDSSNPDDDTWAMFARNWGDEGYCAENQHNLPGDRLKMMIPWLPGSTGVIVSPATQFYVFSNSSSNATVPSPQITIAAGQGVLVDFGMADPSQQLGVEGELHLQWSAAGGPGQLTTSLRNRKIQASTVRGNVSQPEAGKPEIRIAALLAKMSPAQQKALQTRLFPPSAQKATLAARRLTLPPAVVVAKLPTPPRIRPVTPRLVRDARSAARGAAIKAALCESYKNSVPGYPKLCGGASRRP